MVRQPVIACAQSPKVAKGKARTPYEFGAKIGIANTNREGLVLAAKSFAAIPMMATPWPRRSA
mgnify:CR=1 FL=1